MKKSIFIFFAVLSSASYADDFVYIKVGSEGALVDTVTLDFISPTHSAQGNNIAAPWNREAPVFVSPSGSSLPFAVKSNIHNASLYLSGEWIEPLTLAQDPLEITTYGTIPSPVIDGGGVEVYSGPNGLDQTDALNFGIQNGSVPPLAGQYHGKIRYTLEKNEP